MTNQPRVPGREHLEAGQTLSDVNRRMAKQLAAAGIATPMRDARWLLAAALGLDSGQVLLQPERTLTSEEISRVAAVLQRRLGREPVSRILGRREFYGISLEVSSRTLDPRPETETLVTGVVRLVRSGACSGGTSPVIVDVGTGTGAIVIALLRELSEATAVAIDIDSGALEIARRNAIAAGVAERARFVHGSWLDDVTGPVDIVVSNPPYIATATIDHLEPEVSLWDPRLALDGGPDGLSAFRAIVPKSLSVLSPGGWLAVEIGAGQQEAVLEIIHQTGGTRAMDRSETWPDLAGISRCVAIRAQRPEQEKNCLARAGNPDRVCPTSRGVRSPSAYSRRRGRLGAPGRRAR